MSKYDDINDPMALNKLLQEAKDIEERKLIRNRLRAVREAEQRAIEERQKQREEEKEQAIKDRLKAAEAEKQRKLEEFAEKAKAPKEESKHDLEQQRRLKEKVDHADKEKQKSLEKFALDAARKTGESSSVSTVTSTTIGKDGTKITTVKTDVSVQKTVGGASYGKPGGAGAGGAAPGKPNFMGGGAGSSGRVTRSPSGIKAMLLDWTKAMTREYEGFGVAITNFSSSWNNGMAFCALIHHFYPEAFDFDKLNPKQRRANFNLAFDTAEKYADIAPLLDTDDMVKMKNPDWKCVFTYVQSFYRKLQNHERNKAMPAPTEQ